MRHISVTLFSYHLEAKLYAYPNHSFVCFRRRFPVTTEFTNYFSSTSALIRKLPRNHSDNS